MDRLHALIDWDRCVIGGSYALASYQGTRAWEPHDIDVMCQVASYEDFVDKATALFKRMGPDAIITKMGRPNNLHAEEMGEERFHDSILGTATYIVGGVPVPVQLVGLQTDDVVAHLAEITDLPACVSYRVDPPHGSQLFHVPERARPYLNQHKPIPASLVCRSRLNKYAERGFKFYNDA